MFQTKVDGEQLRCIGVSNFLESHLETLLDECSIYPMVNQCEFHPFNNPKSLRDYCSDLNISFQVNIYEKIYSINIK